MTAAEVASPGGWRVWWWAARPRTLAVSLGPVAVGSAVAASEGGARLVPALAALGVALLLQIGSNLANDVYDFEKGADTEARIGPPRATQQGWISPTGMRRGMWGVLAAALGAGLYLTWVAGWPVLVVGLVCIAAAVAYTGGPLAYGYRGLGDLMVFVFFGVVAVVGTTYVQTLALSSAALAASLPVGALATAILVVNNLRDVETDRAVGKRTLAVRLGADGARAEYAALLAVAYGSLPLFWGFAGASVWIGLPVLTLPLAVRRLREVYGAARGAELNATLGATAQLGLLFNLLLALGCWL